MVDMEYLVESLKDVLCEGPQAHRMCYMSRGVQQAISPPRSQDSEMQNFYIIYHLLQWTGGPCSDGRSTHLSMTSSTIE